MSDQTHWTHAPGTKRGSERAISQRKAVSDGYEVADMKSLVKLNQEHRAARHCVEVPGMTRGCK